MLISTKPRVNSFKRLTLQKHLNHCHWIRMYTTKRLGKELEPSKMLETE